MNDPLADLRVERVPTSRLPEVDFSSLGFGNVFSDHMFSMCHLDGRWQRPEIVPCEPIPLHPGCLALHYGQSVFEGLKAFRGGDGRIRLFRPDRNARRFEDSCRRLCVPPLPEGLFERAIEELVRMDREWIPRARGQALYIRPIVFAEESHLEVRPATRYRFVVMTAPVRNYYDPGVGAVALKVQDRYTRAAPGGVGFAKTAGNYAASLLPGDEARREGYDQALWLDGAEHRYVEEVGQMNIFFHIGDRVVTPSLRGTILPGVTRECVIELLRDSGHRVEERLVEISEIVEASERGSLREAFGAGTAAVVTPVGRIGYRGRDCVVNEGRAGPLSRMLYDAILGIQLGERNDSRGWTRIVEV